MDRLNSVLGPAGWDWEILDLTVENILMGQKDGQRASCLGRLTLRIDGQAVIRDGVGEMEMIGHDGARKAACSVSFRHACKFFTTFLWRGEASVSPPVASVAPTPSTPTEPAKTQEKPAEEWEKGLVEEWDEVMAAIAENTRGLTRGEFETKVLLHGTKFEDKKAPGRWVIPNMKEKKNFAGLADSSPKWALGGLKEARVVRDVLKMGKGFTLQVPVWTGSGHNLEEFRITSRNAEEEEETPEERPEDIVSEEVPF